MVCYRVPSQICATSEFGKHVCYPTSPVYTDSATEEHWMKMSLHNHTYMCNC